MWSLGLRRRRRIDKAKEEGGVWCEQEAQQAPGMGTEKRWVVPTYKGEALGDSRNGACSWHELGTEHRGELGKIEGRIMRLVS